MCSRTTQSRTKPRTRVRTRPRPFEVRRVSRVKIIGLALELRSGSRVGVCVWLLFYYPNRCGFTSSCLPLRQGQGSSRLRPRTRPGLFEAKSRDFCPRRALEVAESPPWMDGSSTPGELRDNSSRAYDPPRRRFEPQPREGHVGVPYTAACC